jgi:hypothetical protein
MNLQNKYFYNFLLSKNSNVVSYAISKLHSTYSTKYNRKQINLSIISKFISSYLDSKKIILKKKHKVEILIISNLVSPDCLKKDLYFGNLDKILNKEKLKTLKVFRNFTNKKQTEFINLKKNYNTILSKRSNYFTELKLLYLSLKEILIFIFLNKYRNVKKYINVKDFISIIPNLRLISQIEELIQIVEPKIIIFTYEGHAWERLLVNLCKKKYKWITSIGYQFSPIKNNQIGFFRKLKNDYNPDYLAVSGQKTFNQIINRINFTKVFKLGSPNFIKKKIKGKKIIDLLVALDSEPSELFKMTNFCIDFANKNNEFNIILRLHPIYSDNLKIIDEILFKIQKINNLHMSRKSLVKDLQNSKYLLFTDTAISITCLSYNVVPIFFYNQSSNNIYDGKFPKSNVVKNNTDLKHILKVKNNSKLSPYFRNYRDKYFERFHLNTLKKIIK